MTQEKIWNYFQSEGIESFSGSIPRLNFLVHQAQRVLNRSFIGVPKVLNIGVGNGWIEKQCVKLGWNTYSLDPSEAVIKKLEHDGLTGKVGYIEAIPFDDSSFDVVFCSEVLEHLSDEKLYLGLEEIKRVLVKSGYLIGTVPFKENLLDNKVICPNCGYIFHRWGHSQFFDKTKMSSILKTVNFEIITLGTYAFPDFSRTSPKGRIKSVLRWILGRLGEPISQPNLVFICKLKE